MLYYNWGADQKIVDREGTTPLQRASEAGTTIVDQDMLIILVSVNR